MERTKQTGMIKQIKTKVETKQTKGTKINIDVREERRDQVLTDGIVMMREKGKNGRNMTHGRSI